LRSFPVLEDTQISRLSVPGTVRRLGTPEPSQILAVDPDPDLAQFFDSLPEVDRSEEFDQFLEGAAQLLKLPAAWQRVARGELCRSCSQLPQHQRRLEELEQQRGRDAAEIASLREAVAGKDRQLEEQGALINQLQSAQDATAAQLGLTLRSAQSDAETACRERDFKSQEMSRVLSALRRAAGDSAQQLTAEVSRPALCPVPDGLAHRSASSRW